MAQSISIPFYAVKLHFPGGEFSMPLMDADAIRLKEPLNRLAEKYQDLFQKKVLNEGEALQILDECRRGDLYEDHVEVAFPAAKDKMSFPAFTFDFDFFYNPSDSGFWGTLPALGIEGYANDLVPLKEQLTEAVKLEFARKKRFSAVQKMVAALWFEAIELEQHNMSLQLYSPAELETIDQKEQKKLLLKVAKKLNIEEQVTFGREGELEQLKKALKNPFNRNVLLVGPSGVGKTALIWELARQRKGLGIEQDIWETTASVMLKELSLDTGWQDNIAFLCRELSETGDFLFVRNFAELFEVGQYSGNDLSIAEYLRSFISRGEISLLSECTEEELARIELRSPNFLSFFQRIRLEEPKKGLEEIILQKVSKIMHSPLLQLEKEAIREVVRLNRRFTPYSGFPGKPIRFLENILINQNGQEIPQDKPPKPDDRTPNSASKTLSSKEVIRYFCDETGVPDFMVDSTIAMDLSAIEAKFNTEVFGQETAVGSVVNLLGAVKTALTRTGKPIASFLFVGPTGVGKTELAKVLAEFMFGNRDRLIRFDMSEFSTTESVTRLIGTGYYSDGLLTSAIRQEPFCVLLFDEIEKANATFYDLLLQILSEGRLTDSRGHLVNFCSSIIIMTSNIGTANMQNNRIGWNKSIETTEVTTHFMTAVEQYFRPELFNRIDQVIPFEPLSKKTVRFVVEREIELFKKREGIRFRNIDLQLDESVLEFLTEEGYHSKYGARHLQRALRERLIIPLARELNLLDFDDRIQIRVALKNKELDFSITSDPLGFDLLMEQWDKITYADQAADLRRRIARLKEGQFYVRLLNELDHLESKKQKLGRGFWKNQKRSEHYSYYLQTRENVARLSKHIEELEMHISLTCMDLATYNTGFENQLKDWERQFFDLKIEIYSRVHPTSDTCLFAIYGMNLGPILDFYLALFREKDFLFTARTVWFREKVYNKEIPVATSPASKASDKASGRQLLRKKSRKYIFQTWDAEKKDSYQPPAPEAGDLLCGIEFQLTGQCAHLYLKEEKGIQRWKLTGGAERWYAINTADKDLKTPAEIHRLDFYNKPQPRRTISPDSVEDKKLKINREMTAAKLVPFFRKTLDKLFEDVLDEVVM